MNLQEISMNNIEVSIIIPVFNVQKYLSRCLDSIFNQTFQNFELIIVNDGSTDNSELIIKEYSSKFNKKMICLSQNNQGQSVARNNAIQHVNGNYIMFIDADDWIESNMLEQMSNIAKLNDSDIVICNYTEHYLNSKKFLSPFNPNLSKYNSVVVWAKLYKTSYWNKFKFRFLQRIYSEDNEISPKLLFHTNKIDFIPDALYNYDKTNVNSITKTQKIYNSFNDVLESLCIYFHDKPIDKDLGNYLLYLFMEIIIRADKFPTTSTLKFMKQFFKFKYCNKRNMHHKLSVILLNFNVNLNHIKIINNNKFIIRLFKIIRF